MTRPVRRVGASTMVLVAASIAQSADKEGAAELRGFLDRRCVACHNSEDKAEAGGLSLDDAAGSDVAASPDVWERVVRRLETRQMPPPASRRPSEAEYDSALGLIVPALDKFAADHPRPGRSETFRRLTRLEYQNAIRDLLSLEIDATAMLPPDESSRGFDNITVGDLTPTLLDRYILAAVKIARLALGSAERSPGIETIRIKGDVTQEDHVEGLPFGTRGGAVFLHNFPRDGVYEIQIRLARDRNEHVEGLREPHELDLLLDRAPVARLMVLPPRDERGHETVDQGLKARVEVKAGPRRFGATFLKNSASLVETKRSPYQSRYNMHRHPRLSPAIFQVSIAGPFDSPGPGGTPSRRLVLGDGLRPGEDEHALARRLVARLARRAYRRPVDDDDLKALMDQFRSGESAGGFESGIEAALTALLVNPNFLFRIEADPPGSNPGSVRRLTDLELASRLSFFIWSSIPDDELLEVAEKGGLGDPATLEGQVRRMLADSKSSSLVSNFASQWLHLRNLDSITPDLRLFPDFDDNLRQSFRRETELLIEETIREDRPVLDLLVADHAYLNQRLAKHYGVPNVYGSMFRRIEGARAGGRGGLLRHGSVLTVTSYATRTSPVIRGKWVMENLLGVPPPPPPADVPALKENSVAATLSVRERLAEHRKNPACAGCHRLMDPAGFALERFDAVGRIRDFEDGRAVDDAGGLPDGREFKGVEGLEAALSATPDLFVHALAEKLTTYALGRVLDHHDAPAVRKIVRFAAGRERRFSSLILGVVFSTPFQMRTAQ